MGYIWISFRSISSHFGVFLKGRQDFNEARLAYRVTKGIWSGNSDVEQLSDLLVHWPVAKKHED
jgi:hypothetical protein